MSFIIFSTFSSTLEILDVSASYIETFYWQLSLVAFVEIYRISFHFVLREYRVLLFFFLFLLFKHRYLKERSDFDL